MTEAREATIRGGQRRSPCDVVFFLSFFFFFFRSRFLFPSLSLSHSAQPRAPRSNFQKNKTGRHQHARRPRAQGRRRGRSSLAVLRRQGRRRRRRRRRRRPRSLLSRPQGGAPTAASADATPSSSPRAPGLVDPRRAHRRGRLRQGLPRPRRRDGGALRGEDRLAALHRLLCWWVWWWW